MGIALALAVIRPPISKTAPNLYPAMEEHKFNRVPMLL